MLKIFKDRKGFTLMETIVTISVIIALAGFVLLVLDPDQIVRKSRDSSRMGDLSALNKALLTADGEFPSGGMGNFYTVYISLPDKTATTTAGTACSGVSGLPALPEGWAYHCAASSTYSNVDGTGWVPVNFSSLASGSPLTGLPTDPRNINTTSSGAFYYTYIYNGDWTLTAPMESKKYISSTAHQDNGADPTRLEVGAGASLWGAISQVAAYWPMDDGAGTVVADVGQNGANGTTCNGVTCDAEGPSWEKGKFDGALSFDGVPDNTSGDWVKVISDSVNLAGTMTATAWLYPKAPAGYQFFLRNGTGADEAFGVTVDSAKIAFQYYSSGYNTISMVGSGVPNNKWTHVAVVRDDSAKSVAFYVNGRLISSTSYEGAAASSASHLGIGGNDGTPSQKFKGLMDDVRLYARALSSSEIRAIYEDTR